MSSPPDWLSLTVTAIPLFGISGSAIAYVIKLYQEASERRYKIFFDLLNAIDGNGPIAAKVGAVYSLRQLPEHADFVERFCKTQRSQITGGNADSLIREFDLTAQAVANRK